jgi:hypothetical protein
MHMDPLVEALHRGALLHPGDHSLDGLPVTVFVVGFIRLVATTLVLRRAGRSWKVWHVPAITILVLWWAGVNSGHSGFRSGAGVLWTLLLLAFLGAPMVKTLRAALQPASHG